jgi:hypothetical protein
MGDWKPDDSGVVRNVKLYYNPKNPFEKDTNFYYWVVPAEAGGAWRGILSTSRGEQETVLQIVQAFQEIKGEMSLRGQRIPITDARLVGDRIRFRVRDESWAERVVMEFNGRVTGDTMTGTIEVRGGVAPEEGTWTARR